MTPEQRQQVEAQIQSDFSKLQKKLEELQNEIKNENDESKKQEKQAEFDKMKLELNDMKNLIDKLSSLQEQDLQSLKTRLEQYSQIRQQTQWEVADLQNEKTPTPTTYELLKDSQTSIRLRSIIESNPNEFRNIPWDSSEAKLEYIFSKIRNNIIILLKNKLWNSENIEKIINNTIAPAFEWNMIELLKNQKNPENNNMLQWMQNISFENFGDLVEWVSNLASNAKWSFDKFSQWMNAVDYLSVHKWVLREPNKSEVLSNPLKFQEYMNNAKFAAEDFSPYTPISENIFKIDENQNFDFGVSIQEKQEILQKIWDIQVVDNPKTASLIVKMLDKLDNPSDFLWKVPKLQETANGLLDWVNVLNSVTKPFGIDFLWESTKSPEERWFLYRIVDFVCKLIWITWWLEWIVKKWRLDKLELTDEKNENISHIYEEYQKLVWKWSDISIMDANSCSAVLSEFNLTDLDDVSTTKWDHLRDVMSNDIDVNLLSPDVVQQTLWDDYLIKNEVEDANWKKQEKVIVDVSKITDEKKRELAHKHIINMKTRLESNFDDLKDFYVNIHNIDDIVLCMTASLYANGDDVIEWVKARVFLPENYGVVHWLASDSWTETDGDESETDGDESEISWNEWSDNWI